MFLKALFVFSLISVAFATVFVTNPTNTTIYSGGKAGAVVSWNDNNIGLSLKDFGPAVIAIYVGNAIQQSKLQVLNSSVDVSLVSSIEFTPDASIGPNGHEYFIRVESLSQKDNTTQHNAVMSFSSRFTLDNMSGTFSSSILAEISGQSTAPLAGETSSGASSPTSTSSPSLTGTSSSKKPTGTSSTTSATARPSSGAMGFKAGWAGIVFGAVVGVTMF